MAKPERASLSAFADYTPPSLPQRNASRPEPVAAVEDLPPAKQPKAADVVFTGAQGGGKSETQRKQVQAVGATGVHVVFPGVKVKNREHLIPFSIRLPIRHIDALKKLESEQGIIPSDLIRHMMDKGFADMFGDSIAEPLQPSRDA
jgi:hypothetical protein